MPKRKDPPSVNPLQTRPLHTMRHEGHLDHRVVETCYQNIMAYFQAGRVKLTLQKKILELCMADVDDDLSKGSVSFAQGEYFDE